MRGLVVLVVLSNLLPPVRAQRAMDGDPGAPVTLSFVSRFSPGDASPAGWLNEPSPIIAEQDGEATSSRPWHIEVCMRTSDTKLSSTKQQLDRRLDVPLSLDILGIFNSPDTPIDRKTEWGITTFYLGIGRQQSDRLVWTAYAGGGAGSDKTHQRVLTANVSTHFSYATAYAGLSLEWYPHGTPPHAPDLTWTDTWGRGRPYLLTGVEVGFVDALGAGDFSLAPVKVYRDRQGIRDWLFSCKLGAGWRWPLDAHWSASLAGDYSFHFYRPEEYNSWNVILGLRFRF